MEKPNCSMYDYMLEQNKKYMDYTALTFGNLKITYEELHQRIDEYARALYKKGIRKGDLICVSAANTPETVYILYALNRIGAIIVPLMAMQNEYKMKQDLELIKPKMIISINDSYRNIRKASRKIQDLDADYLLFSPLESVDNLPLKALYNLKNMISGNFTLNPSHSLKNVVNRNGNNDEFVEKTFNPNDVSHILFTGGSTGVHKGVDLKENGLNSVVYSVSRFSPLNPGEVFMVNIPINIAFGNISLQTALCNNLEAALTLKGFPKDFVSELKRLQPSAVYCGPIHIKYLNDYILSKLNLPIESEKIDFDSYIELIKDALDKTSSKEFDFSNLKCFCSGGEKLYNDTEQVAKTILEHYGCQYGIWNGLGMTEFWGTVSLKKGKNNTDGTIGNLIPGLEMRIVDPITFEDVKIGEKGLLLLKGPSMMKGYHNNPKATEEVMLGGYFNTGDIVVQNANGELIYVDRLKRQFVCGIDNVYPQEIENMVGKLPEVEEILITKIKDSNLQFVPKYHIYIKDGVDVNALEAKIKKLICSSLGESSLARYYEYHCEPLPRTDNGKLDPKPLQQSDDEKAKRLTLKV